MPHLLCVAAASRMTPACRVRVTRKMKYASSAARRSAPARRSPRRAKSSSIGIGVVAIASLLVPCVVLAGGYLMSAPFGAGSVAWAAVPMQVETPVRADPPTRRADRLVTSRSVDIDVPHQLASNAEITGSLGSAGIARCGGDRIARQDHAGNEQRRDGDDANADAAGFRPAGAAANGRRAARRGRGIRHFTRYSNSTRWASSARGSDAAHHKCGIKVKQFQNEDWGVGRDQREQADQVTG